jgi:hypothetical protein
MREEAFEVSHTAGLSGPCMGAWDGLTTGMSSPTICLPGFSVSLGLELFDVTDTGQHELGLEPFASR